MDVDHFAFDDQVNIVGHDCGGPRGGRWRSLLSCAEQSRDDQSNKQRSGFGQSLHGVSLGDNNSCKKSGIYRWANNGASGWQPSGEQPSDSQRPLLTIFGKRLVGSETMQEFLHRLYGRSKRRQEARGAGGTIWRQEEKKDCSGPALTILGSTLRISSQPQTSFWRRTNVASNVAKL